MSTVFTKREVDEFVLLCNWVWQSWRMQRLVFHDNERGWERMMQSAAVHAYGLWADICKRHSLLEIRKLHDPAATLGHPNMSIAHVVEAGGWDPVTFAELKVLQGRLDAFGAHLKDLRNKALGHNDKAAMLTDVVLGGFAADAEVEYFKDLEEFVSVVLKGAGRSRFRYEAEFEPQVDALRLIQDLGITALAAKQGVALSDPVDLPGCNDD